MWKRRINSVTAAVLFAVAATGCDSAAVDQEYAGGNTGNVESVLKTLPIDIPSPIETEGLVFMREEEKLAHDVYVVLYDAWGAKVFNNIAASEQKHTDAIKLLLDRYGIEDPVTDSSVGVFKNEVLAGLYATLVETGKKSVVDALMVGAAIEEIDIRDIMTELTDNVDNADITFVYESLLAGSGNHLRAFVSNLAMQGVDYAPQYLDDALYESIIESTNTSGNGGGNGRHGG